MPTYSFGVDSPIKFEISDKMAVLYNQAAEEFFRAQERFKRKHNRSWDPATEPIKMKWTKAQRKAWNQFARVFDKVNEEQGPFHVNDLMDDFLIKNSVQTAAAAMAVVPRFISLAAACGTLYVLLRGLKGHV